jgi:type III secretory pathway component EscS
MDNNQIAVIVLALVGLILALINQARANWQSTTEWAIILVAVAVLVLAVNPL